MKISYEVGKALGRHPLAAIAVLGAVFVGVVSASVANSRDQEAKKAAASKAQQLTIAGEAALAAQKQREIVDSCNARAPALASEARTALQRKNPADAYTLLSSCAEHFTDPAIRQLYVRARDDAAAQAGKSAEARRRTDAAEKKKAGVQIGMTTDEVLASSWGKPQHINTTTTARGVSQQWVYGGRNYLYFDNGVLRTIQN